MSKKGKHVRVCHVCGEVKPLTFEHVPPQMVGNKSMTRVHPVVDISLDQGIDPINRAEAIFDTSGKRMPRGSGRHSLCIDCNTYFGGHYVEPWSSVVLAAAKAFQSMDQGTFMKSSIIDKKEFPVLAFIKQIVSMFAATTQPGTMHDCAEFLLDRNNTSLPKRHRLFMYALPEANTAVSTSGYITIGGGFNTPNPYWCEIAHIRMHPFGYYLVDCDRTTSKIPDYGMEITGMSNYAWDDRLDVRLSMPNDLDGRLLPPIRLFRNEI